MDPLGFEALLRSAPIMQGLPFWKWLTRQLMIAPMLFSSLVFTFDPNFSLASPLCFATVRNSKLISPGAGWVIVDQPSDNATGYDDCSYQHLYWTDNNGQAWREITPPHMPT